MTKLCEKKKMCMRFKASTYSPIVWEVPHHDSSIYARHSLKNNHSPKYSITQPEYGPQKTKCQTLIQPSVCSLWLSVQRIWKHTDASRKCLVSLRKVYPTVCPSHTLGSVYIHLQKVQLQMVFEQLMLENTQTPRTLQFC